jgi:hypothetical protein
MRGLLFANSSSGRIHLQTLAGKRFAKAAKKPDRIAK